MITYLGELNLAALSPISVSCAASLSGSLSADVALLGELSVGIGLYPPSNAVQITLLAAIITELNAGISAGLTLPSVNFMADVIAELEAILAVPLSFQLLLGGGAGIFTYAYDGPSSSFGSSVSQALSSSWPDGTSGSAACNALVLATTAPTVWSNLIKFFGAVPPSLPSGLTFLSECNIGSLAPICGRLTAGIIADLNARLAGMLRISITPPSIDLSANRSAALALKAALEAALQLNLPGASFQASAVLSLIAKVNAQITAFAAFSAILAGGSVMAFLSSGTGAGLGPALTTAVGGGWPDGSGRLLTSNALIMGVVSPAVWATFTTFFGGI